MKWYSVEELADFASPSSQAAKRVEQEAAPLPNVEVPSGPSFYGKSAQGVPRHQLRGPPREPRERREQDDATGGGLDASRQFMMPRRPQRANGCSNVDKEMSGCKSYQDVYDVALRDVSVMDAANWANVFYALAHFKKRAVNEDAGRLAQKSMRNDARFTTCCGHLVPRLAELTARDNANVLWSLATLDARQEPVFMEVASSLCDDGNKLAVCDPVSISKSAWALTQVENRERRLELYDRLAVPVVLRTEVFPLGSLTMTCYAFAKAAHRDANVYEALSSAMLRHVDEELRPIDVCNVIWAFCTVGYRDDELFTRLCDRHLTDVEGLTQHHNPQDLTNITWGFSKVGFIHKPALEALAHACVAQRGRFEPIHFSNFLYSFAQLRVAGPLGATAAIACAAVAKLERFDAGNLAIATWALAQLSVRDDGGFVDAALRKTLRPEVCTALSSRALSMLFLAFFRLGRPVDGDRVFEALKGTGAKVGASGFSAAVSAAEHGVSTQRELEVLIAMAEEAEDDRMCAAIMNSAAIRLSKRGCLDEALALLRRAGQSDSRRWSAVSQALLLRLEERAGDGGDESMRRKEVNEIWVAPVQSGIHPMAATRQNENGHAYTREFMTLQAVLCGAPRGNVDACMAAVEQFAESRSLWLKITAWEKATVVHEVARLRKPRIAIEIGAYVGYSAMNIGRAVRPHGGKVVSMEVDPIHVTIARNMIEYAGLTDTVDIFTGYCFDVIPQLLTLYGPRSIDMVFMDQKGTRFHSDLALLEELELLADGAVVLADNVLKPGAPLYIWHLCTGPYQFPTAISVREFLLQSEDWMVMAFYDESKKPPPVPHKHLHRLAFESDAFRQRSMFDSVAPSKQDWWNFSHRFVEGLESCGSKPRIVGLHGRDNPVINPEDIAAIFRNAGRLV